MQRAIALSLECEPSTSEDKTKFDKPKVNPAEFSFLENFTDADFASSSSDEEETITKHSKAKMSSAQSYMLEYSGLTPNEIAKIINTEVSSTTSKKLKVVKTPSLPVVSEDITSTTEVKEDSVEIMSSTDSSDAEDEKKILNVIINPTTEFNKEDDLFADIFEPEIPKNEDSEATSISDKGDDVVPEIFTHSKEPLETIAEKIVDRSKITKDDSIMEITDVIVKDSKKPVEEKVLNVFQDVTSTVVQEKDQQISNAILNDKLIISNEQQNEDQSISNASTRSLENDNGKNDVRKPSISEQDLKDLKEQLQRDKVDLINEKSAKERMAGNITDQMYQEAQVRIIEFPNNFKNRFLALIF